MIKSIIKEIRKRSDEFLKFLLRFSISMILGIIIVFSIKFFLSSQNLITQEDIKKFIPTIRKLIEPYLPIFERNYLYQIVFIFLNNVRVLILAGFLSFITFGLFAEIVTYINGFIVGIVISSLSLILPNMNPVKIFIFGILPHGLFEIFAFLLSLTFAHKLSPTKRGLEELNFYFKTYIIVIPLLIIASIIEVIITPILLSINI